MTNLKIVLIKGLVYNFYTLFFSPYLKEVRKISLINSNNYPLVSGVLKIYA
jgi:hypothetical protein